MDYLGLKLLCLVLLPTLEFTTAQNLNKLSYGELSEGKEILVSLYARSSA